MTDMPTTDRPTNQQTDGEVHFQKRKQLCIIHRKGINYSRGKEGWPWLPFFLSFFFFLFMNCEDYFSQEHTGGGYD